jgi:hypothetical protein
VFYTSGMEHSATSSIGSRPWDTDAVARCPTGAAEALGAVSLANVGQQSRSPRTMTDRDKVSAFLQAHVGSYFCSFCVSREVRIDSFTARDLVWQLQELPGYEMRSAKCVSCGRRKRIIAAVGGFALLGPEAHVVSFLVTNKGFAFCNACVAFANEISLQEAERVLAHLRPLPEFERLAASECSVVRGQRDRAHSTRGLRPDGELSRMADRRAVI